MVIKADKLLNKSSGRLAMQKAQQEKMVGGGPSNIVLSKKSIKGIEGIKINVIKIEDILKGSLALDKKQLDDKKKATSKKRKEDIETKLETKPNAESGKVKMPSAPRMGILDFIKNFIGNVLLGYFAVRLIKHLPKIMPIVKFLGNAADFIIDVGGKLLNGLVTFIDIGDKAYDKTRGFIKNLGGENFAKGFDKFLGAIDTALFLTTVLAGSMAMEAMSGGGGGGPGGTDPRKQPTRTTSGGQPQGKPDIRNPLRQRPTVTTGGSTPRPMGGGPKITGSTSGGSKLRLPKGIKARGGLLGLVFLIPDLIESGMLLSQGRGKDGIRTLISAVSGVAAGMAAYAGVIAGAAALGITGVGIPAAIALAVAGFGASYFAGEAAYNLTEAGLRKMGLVDNDPKTGKPYTYKGGGITRGGKSAGKAKRTFGGMKKKQTYKRTIAQKPTQVQIKPGADVGGEDKIFGIFPNPFKAAKKVIDAVNPFNIIKTTGENLGKTDYFGPILAITSKMILGEKPDQMDYKNVGLGLNLLIAKGVQDGQLKGGIIPAFAEGGLVDPDVLSAVETGGDISSWVSNTFRGEIETGAQKTMRLIKESMDKKKAEQDASSGEGGGTTGDFAPGSVSGGQLTMEQLVGLAKGAGFPTNEAIIMAAIAKGESGGNSNAKNFKPPDKSYGLWQINMIGKLGPARMQEFGLQREDQLFDPVTNAKAAYAIRKSQGLSAWTIYKNGAYKNHLSAAEAAKNAPSLRTSPTMTNMQPGSGMSVSISAASGSAGDRQKNAGDLGSFIKSLGVARGSGVTEHPKHGGVGSMHRGRGHYEGRAIDIGGYGGKYGRSETKRKNISYIDDQPAILAGINKFTQKTGIKPSLVLHGDNDPGHWNHVHAEYAKGGETLGRPHFAMLGEKGEEGVIDADSYPHAKDMLLAINQAKGYKGVMSAISQYAPYDAMSPQTIVIPSPSAPEDDDYGSDGGGGGMLVASGGGGDDPYSTLYQGG